MQKFELCAPWPYVEVKVSLLGSKELMLSFHVVFDRLQHDVESLKKILEHTFLELSGEMLESFSGEKILQRSATKFLAKRKKLNKLCHATFERETRGEIRELNIGTIIIHETNENDKFYANFMSI